MKFLSSEQLELELPAGGHLPATYHVFEPDDVRAINAALAAHRPLLVRGEPGTGKSQLARAAAQGLGRAFVSTVIDARTEPGDLQWRFDAVRRLADAQVLGEADRKKVADLLDEEKYVEPGPLWWAFNWGKAADFYKDLGWEPPPLAEGCSPENGVVLLLDEIDKADSSVPNGLLEALGHGEFRGPRGKRISCVEPQPLVVVTTNEERSLPDAFLRRCFVLQLRVPSSSELESWLVKRGRAHARAFERAVWPELLQEAAKLLRRDREVVRESGYSPPGAAEYLDLVRAVVELADSPEQQERVLEDISAFALRKHPLDYPGEGS